MAPFSPAQLSWFQFVRLLLASPSKLYPDPSYLRIKDKVKYCMRGLARPFATKEWFECLHQPDLLELVRSHPLILSKLQRPYLYRGLTIGEQLQFLKEHYTFMLRTFPVEVRSKIYSRTGTPLAKIILPDVGGYNLFLFYGDMFQKEGELTLVLSNEQTGGRLFALTFTIINEKPDSREIFIGGLQGFRRTTDKEEVVLLTRAMHGLRPKALLLFSLQQLAIDWDVKSIRAVSDRRSIYTDFRLKKKNVLASYDEFWTDSQGVLGQDGLFILPPLFVARDISEIKPAKRSLYRRRYDMLGTLGIQISSSLLNTTRY